MTFKDKIIFFFLIIITLGIYPILIFKKNKNENKNRLKVEKKISINILKLINIIGQKNIVNVNNTHTKVTIYILERKNIDINEIKKLKNISGVLANSNSITILVGKNAETIKNKIESILIK